MFAFNLLNSAEISSKPNDNIFLYIFIAVAVAVLVLLALSIIIVKHVNNRISFETNGGSKIPPLKIKKGEPFQMPDPPTKEGFAFGGWYTDKDCTVRFIETKVFKNKIKKIYAKWYESNIPKKFVSYFEKLRNMMLSYAKVGVLGNTSVYESEVLAKLFADENCVSLYVALGRKSMLNEGFIVEDVSEDYPSTPTKLEITEKESFHQAKKLVEYLMAKKGLQNVGLEKEPKPMTIKERKHGFEFKIENERVAVSLSEYYELLRVYAKGFALAKPNGVENGEVVARMYLTEDCVELYLDLETKGLLEKSDRFEDTPSLYKVHAQAEFIEKAYRFIDRAMAKKGMVKRNENANNFVLRQVEKGCGCAFAVNINEN